MPSPNEPLKKNSYEMSKGEFVVSTNDRVLSMKLPKQILQCSTNVRDFRHG